MHERIPHLGTAAHNEGLQWMLAIARPAEPGRYVYLRLQLNRDV